MDYKKHAKQAYEAFNAGDNTDVIRHLTLTIELFPKEWEEGYDKKELASFCYLNRGVAYSNIKDYKKALTDYTKAIELDIDLAGAYNNRGNIYRDLKDYKKAIADYNKAIELNKEFAEAYNNRGIVYYDIKDYKKAIADYNKAIELNKDYADAYSNRGDTYKNLKNYHKALADYNNAIELNKDDSNTYNGRGNLYAKFKYYEKALVDFSKAIELDLKCEIAYNNRGNVYKNLKDYKKAIADYNKAIELNSRDINFYYNLAKCYEELQEKKLAKENYAQMFHLFKVHSDLEEHYTSTQKENTISIFKFSPLNEYTLKTLMREELFLARPHKDWNDPHDCNITPWTNLAHNTFKEKARLQCFFAGEEPFRKILMWSHYADKHKGICVEYEYDLNRENPIASLHAVKYQQEIDFNELGDAFKIKAEAWGYENEVRLFHFDENNTEETSVLKPFDKLGLKVKAVYFGERLRNADKDMITTVQNIFKYKEAVQKFLKNHKNLNVWSVDAIKTLLFAIAQEKPVPTKHEVKFFEMTTQKLSFVLHATQIEEEEPAITTPA